MDDKAFKDFNDFMTSTIVPGLISIADKHNYDRDDFIKYTAIIMSTMAEAATFENYKLPEAEEYDIYGDTE